MKRTVIFTALCALGIQAPARAQSYIQQCAASLQVDKTVVQNNFAAKMAFLEQIDKSNFDEVNKKTNLGGIMGDASFNGTWNDFETKVSRLHNQVQSTANLDISTGYAQYALSQSGAASFGECVKANSTRPLVAFVEVATREIVVVHVVKRDPNGTSFTDTLDITYTGGDELGTVSRVFINNSEAAYTFTRHSGVPFVATFNLQRLNSGTGAATIMVPKYIKVRVEHIPTDVISGPVSVKCGGNGRGDTTQSSPATLAATPGRHLVMDTVQPIVVNTPDPGEGPQITGYQILAGGTDTRVQAVATCTVRDKEREGTVTLKLRGTEIEDKLIVEN